MSDVKLYRIAYITSVSQCMAWGFPGVLCDFDIRNISKSVKSIAESSVLL